MRIAAVSHVEMTVDQTQASAKIQLKTTWLQAVLLIGVSLTGMACLIYPLALIAHDAVVNPQVVHPIAENLGSTLLLGAGFLVGLALLTVPLRFGIARLGAAATVQLANGLVQVQRQGVLGLQTWAAPLSQYCGVTHHIRATLSGPRHEIILVHTEPAKDVLLSLGHRHPQEGAAYYADLLGVGEVQPRTLYQRRRAAPDRSTPPQTPLPQAA